MARININIEAEDVRDLHFTLVDLLHGYNRQPLTHEVQHIDEPEYETEGPASDNRDDLQPAGEAVKRTRRTKAQIEADNAAQAAGGSHAAPAAPVATVTATKPDPFSEQVKEAVADAATVTQADVRSAGSKYMDTHGPEGVVKVLQEVGGVDTIKDLSPDKYALAVAKFVEG